jgi:hypothetical protein
MAEVVLVVLVVDLVEAVDLLVVVSHNLWQVSGHRQRYKLPKLLPVKQLLLLLQRIQMPGMEHPTMP